MDKRYKVLREGVSQRDPNSGKLANVPVGDVIALTDGSAEFMLAEGWVESADGSSSSSKRSRRKSIEEETE